MIAADLEVAVDPLRDQVDRLQQLRQPVQRQEVGLERDEDLGRRAEGVERQDAQRRRAVHQDVVELLGVGVELVAEDHLAADGAEQLELGAGQVDVAAADGQVRARPRGGRSSSGMPWVRTS